ncbi:MAG: hypothetical protein A2Y62_20480 [Candidatus Fischerbacteria bacterium RBG_13_37_8]|uniref:VCBS repeat-containing protein n=1 Tax=Candidatus Fischerbacteria bacterium RBG_13_37_8 TaxID=1817863 RepID=A0A1F5VX64_9BACT|nr:MAG: hypothetical protein A2Y62_20480 [Candidatus Fischerbacteria bacterium RBG_13_37_8]
MMVFIINAAIASMILMQNYGDYAAVIESNANDNILCVVHNNRRIEKSLGMVNAWKLLLHDIDKDGFPEVLIGVKKKAHFDPVEKKRIRIYSLDENGIYPFYFATFAPGEILDFAYYDDYLLLLHPGNRISALQWDEFGFVGESFYMKSDHNRESQQNNYACLCDAQSCFAVFWDQKAWHAQSIKNCGR